MEGQVGDSVVFEGFDDRFIDVYTMPGTHVDGGAVDVA
jgi:hypothetical protein